MGSSVQRRSTEMGRRCRPGAVFGNAGRLARSEVSTQCGGENAKEEGLRRGLGGGRC